MQDKPQPDMWNISLRSEEERTQGLGQFAGLLAKVEAGELDGLAVRGVMADGTVVYKTIGKVSAEDLAELLLRCASDRL